jgi:hypothetical protein
MKNTNGNKNKIVSLGIILGITLTFFILKPLNWFSTGALNHSTSLNSSPKISSEIPLLTLKQSTNQATNEAPKQANNQATTQATATTQSIAGKTIAGKMPPLPDHSPALSSLIADGCFKLTFAHKKQASHDDGEVCLLHKNLIVLNHFDQAQKSKIDPQSICMRINDKAVKYSFVPGKPGQILLGPEAGPNAKITASYCVGKAKCSKSCTPEKDSFLSAIGADENNDPAQTVGWDGQKGKTKEDTEVETQMTALGQEINSESSGEHSQIFSGWILEKQTAQCEQTRVFETKVAHLSLDRKQ